MEHREAWGLAVWAANAKHDTPAAFDKLHSRFVRQGVPGADLQPSASAGLGLQPFPSATKLSLRTLGHLYVGLRHDAGHQPPGAGIAPGRRLAWGHARRRPRRHDQEGV